MGFDTGAEKVRMSGGPVNFYENYQTTNLYVERTFDALLNTLIMANDSTTDTVYVSFNGTVRKGDIYPKESMEINVSDKTSIYLRGATGGGYVRVWGY